MAVYKKTIRTSVLLIFFIITNSALAQTELSEKISAIRKDIEEIRGKQFKREVSVEKQSLEGFGDYIDKNIELQFSQTLSDNFDKIVRTLGLYRGEEITDFKAMVKMVMQSQAAAYYDPDKSTFFVVMQDLPEQMLKAVFAHELYHGFQDQYFNLDNYFLKKLQENELNDDQLLARQAVVEGEATYMMTLWSTKKMFGTIPDLSVLQMAMDMQANLSTKQLLEMVKSAAKSNPALGEDIQYSAQAMNDIPGFMLDSMIGAYLKGMRFVYEMHKKGWAKVAELYENPPVSTEQILHPEKWLVMEKPFSYKWPDFNTENFLKDWELLEKNTLGEMQWRSIFSAFDLDSLANEAAAGWDGDSYAIFENSDDKQHIMLLLITSWDTEKDAMEFKDAYSVLQQAKYAENPNACKYIKQDGQDIFIVESSIGMNCLELVKILTEIEKKRLH